MSAMNRPYGLARYGPGALSYIYDERRNRNEKHRHTSGSARRAYACLFAGAASAELKSETRAKILDLNVSIKSGGAKWVAGETSVSGLSEAQWKDLAGLDLTPISGPTAPESSERGLPSSVDWRDAGGNFVTPPRNQKSCGSCWAFAMTGALESYVLRKENKPGTDLDLSEQVYISCSSAGSCKGGAIFPRFLAREGLPLESAYPYTAANGSCSAASPGWEKTAYKISDWGVVWPLESKIKAALAHYGPLPTSMLVYEDFMHYKSGVYSRVSGKPVGGHAVLIVGYNDQDQCFIVKNSWGPNWGEGGFFRIAYSEMHSRVIFGLSTVAFY